jgi:hypothetical protein
VESSILATTITPFHVRVIPPTLRRVESSISRYHRHSLTRPIDNTNFTSRGVFNFSLTITPFRVRRHHQLYVAWVFHFSLPHSLPCSGDTSASAPPPDVRHGFALPEKAPPQSWATPSPCYQLRPSQVSAAPFAKYRLRRPDVRHGSALPEKAPPKSWATPSPWYQLCPPLSIDCAARCEGRPRPAGKLSKNLGLLPSLRICAARCEARLRPAQKLPKSWAAPPDVRHGSALPEETSKKRGLRSSLTTGCAARCEARLRPAGKLPKIVSCALPGSAAPPDVRHGSALPESFPKSWAAPFLG